MATLIHEIWEDEDEGSISQGMCLAGPDGDGFRRLLSDRARCVHRVEAGCHFEAMTIHYRLYNRGTTLLILLTITSPIRMIGLSDRPN